MNWRDLWLELFGARPADPTSREVSVQEVLAFLIAGQKCAWFEAHVPTERGVRFLKSIWAAAFGDAGEIDWFVSEYELAVPPGWRDEIPFTYRCPDFACGDNDRILVIELKTERASYQARQMADYLRLVRHKLPTCWCDMALLGPHLPAATPARDERQRYAELTWSDVPARLVDAFSDDPLAHALSTFLLAELAAPPAHEPLAGVSTLTTEQPRPTSQAVDPIDLSDRIAAAIGHAQRLAPSVGTARAGDQTERGIDVDFPTVAAARQAQARVRETLDAFGFGDRVSVWLWQPSSTGTPTTPAGQRQGRELRLAPKLTH